MRYVLCLLDPSERGIADDVCRAYETLPQARGLEFAWRTFDHAAVLTAWDDPWGDPLIASDGGWLAVGMVRLDNREDVERWVDAIGLNLTDLQLVLRLVARTRGKRIRDLLGDFAFVIWHGAERAAVAAADALGVKKLFYSERKGLVAFATRAEALVLEERYEPQHLAELVALCQLTPGLTAYAGVQRLPAGTTATAEGGNLMLSTYWSPEQFEADPYKPKLEREAPMVLRELLAESVRQRLGGRGETWAQLSGGLDSSSIVSISQWLVERGAVAHGLAGTVTFVDWQGTGADEREYSDAVAVEWQVRNETIIDPPVWVDGALAPPHVDQPRDTLAFAPREQRLCRIVRAAGGRVLLSGLASDELLTGTTMFFADWLAQGRMWAAARELARWAARGRLSVWKLAYQNALLPLVPQALRHPKSFNEGRLLPWVTEGAARRYRLRSRAHSLTGNEGRLGRKYRDMMVRMVNAVTTQLDAGTLGDALDVRYPFLARPLVEFALRLPPQLCARPHARKWVLRQAMGGILPEAVRTRVGKGASTDVLVRSFTAQRTLLWPLVQGSILAQLGVVDEQSLRDAYEAAPRVGSAERDPCADVQNTLMIEAWLRIRSGRWPPGLSS